MTDTCRAPLGIAPQVRLPQSHNLPSARPHVTVLGSVQRHPAEDASLPARALPVVPVVTVELDDETGRRDRRVGGELAAEGRLPQILHAEAVEQRVAQPFRFRRAAELLTGVHREQHGAALGVGVTTCEGAVGDPVGAGRRAGRGPAEGAAARLARVLGLVPALVFVVAIEGAEKPFALTDSGSLHVELRAALFALPIFTRPPSGRSTRTRAPALIYVVVPVGLCAASFADEGFSRCNPFALQGAEAGSSCPRATHPEGAPANLTVLISRAGGFAFTLPRTESRFVRILAPSLK